MTFYLRLELLSTSGCELLSMSGCVNLVSRHQYCCSNSIWIHFDQSLPKFSQRAPLIIFGYSVQFGSVTQSCLNLCDPMDCSTPGFPVHHQFLELAQTHVHRVGEAVQPSHSLSSPSPPALNLSQHQGLSKWVSSSHQVAKGLEFQLQHQSFQWIFRTDFL